MQVYSESANSSFFYYSLSHSQEKSLFTEIGDVVTGDIVAGAWLKARGNVGIQSHSSSQ